MLSASSIRSRWAGGASERAGLSRPKEVMRRPYSGAVPLPLLKRRPLSSATVTAYYCQPPAPLPFCVTQAKAEQRAARERKSLGLHWPGEGRAGAHRQHSPVHGGTPPEVPWGASGIGGSGGGGGRRGPRDRKKARYLEQKQVCSGGGRQGVEDPGRVAVPASSVQARLSPG